MAPMKQDNNYSSSNYGEAAAARQANVLASCYLVDSSWSVQGLHYCTTSVTAITSDNELALTPKAGKQQQRRSGSSTAAGTGGSGIISSSSGRSARNGGTGGGGGSGGRGGATSRIREECERFFCETMWAVFRGERNSVARGSRLTGVYYDDKDDGDDGSSHHNRRRQHHQHDAATSNGQLNTPPDDYPFPADDRFGMAARGSGQHMANGNGGQAGGGEGGGGGSCNNITAWLEIWDYVGGSGFRGFIAEDFGGEKSAFVFFDAGVMGRDLKQALVAIIELADEPLRCSQLVVAIDRAIPEREAKSLMKGLQWAGFELCTLDHWSGGVLDVTSDKWLFMAYEV